MKLKLLLPFGLILLIISACSHVYAPALYHQDIAYQPKPSSFDAKSSQTYVSAGLNNYAGVNWTDFLTSGQVNLSQGYRFDNFNVAYGAFGVFGDYQYSGSKEDANYFTDKFFGAVGGRFSANAFVTSGNTDFRFIGVEMAYSHEFGDYLSYRQELFRRGGYFVDPRTDLYTVGLTMEVLFHSKNNSGIQHGFRGFLGTTLGHNDLNDTYYTDDNYNERFFHNYFPKLSYFITFKNYFGTAEIGNNFFIRFGYKF
ncbi:MAG TPA: hypothetical protein VL442_19715 [Mucilaginibacter sp.]|jgi:hypothetical protein|nr:hypothetical protein [Mucilaginibacter sp.]